MTCRNADIVIGGQVRQTVLNHYVNPLGYFEDDITWYVQRAKLRAKWKSPLLYVFLNWEVILCLFLTIIPFVGIAYAQSTFERRPLDIWGSIFVIIQMIAATSSTYNPDIVLHRFLDAYFRHACFFGVSIVSSFIFMTITSPQHDHQISSFQEIGEANLHLAVESEMKAYLTSEQIESFFVCMNMDECMDIIVESDTVAVAVSRQYSHFSPHSGNIFCFGSIRSDLVVQKMRETGIDPKQWNRMIQHSFVWSQRCRVFKGRRPRRWFDYN